MASGHENRARRPNTWLHRPSCKREENPCQRGAVHTWHFCDIAAQFQYVWLGPFADDSPRRHNYNLVCCGSQTERQRMAEDGTQRRLSAILAADVARGFQQNRHFRDMVRHEKEGRFHPGI